MHNSFNYFAIVFDILLKSSPGKIILSKFKGKNDILSILNFTSLELVKSFKEHIDVEINKKEEKYLADLIIKHFKLTSCGTDNYFIKKLKPETLILKKFIFKSIYECEQKENFISKIYNML